MARIVILGAGLGGAIMAYEMKDQLRKDDELIVIGPPATEREAFRPDDWYTVFRAVAGTEAAI